MVQLDGACAPTRRYDLRVAERRAAGRRFDCPRFFAADEVFGRPTFWAAFFAATFLTSPLAADLNRDLIGELAPTYGLRPVAHCYQ
jgi:hypothetical protein